MTVSNKFVILSNENSATIIYLYYMNKLPSNQLIFTPPSPLDKLEVTEGRQDTGEYAYFLTTTGHPLYNSGQNAKKNNS
ncbi:MAG: hypothetical protein COV55_02380 [Candidatus Komeilibacteria bacterium CG11_big_fil_rev_8_21_14_0_20_36_20]|uniref:Uncharacterized protein n=1 Tax=Candidatus Komeilibacteria bacterium CG11_big_fil_rev_8_21_14_0_20_36_20 TaxID=1974477 RepID=A0A2H0ND53_9BACT|nr:MAG: hypothetical protein COV55_02380 [Candidatus Komeilibacteria bacterium CG11_big_fil_rev_8_21_14_0_20_36_20]PIR81820.1 MAG: hypothetical protein COU21_01440 [Candidatus Komeilibacteria bacterium CG10_big_fil_rev_8_21_14_0_10_36_65]PJC55310.1 MAG: hypothetical protein CO027_02775 [Candidatus Komeilibacteria bacterium CG_4_9_14_0_2_um_filter_36_13]